MKLKTAFLISIIFTLFANFIYAKSSGTPSSREKFIVAAKSYLGTPYSYGGISKSGIDCSGLVYRAALDSGVATLPRTAASIYSKIKKIPDSEREAGDLVFFAVSGRVNHVGIYLGKGRFIHSASDGAKTGVIISNLSENYWKMHYCGTGRFLKPSGQKTSQNKTSSSNSTTSKSSSSASSNSKSSSKSKSPSKPKTNQRKKARSYSSSINYDEETKSTSFVADFSGFFDWNFFSEEKILFIPKGGSLQAQIKTDIFNHNLGLLTRLSYVYDRNNSFFQSLEFPIGLTFGINDYIELYGGVVFPTNKNSKILLENGKEIENQIFPGFFGIKFQTPEIKLNEFSSLAFCQDISYTIYKSADSNVSVSFQEGLSEGLSLNSGITFRLKF